MTLIVLRTLLLIVVLAGLFLNAWEMGEAFRMRGRIRKAKLNGLREQSADNLISFTRSLFGVSVGLAIIVGVTFMAPTPNRASTPFAIVSRVTFLAMAVHVTRAGWMTRKGRLKTVVLIDAEEAEESKHGTRV